MSSRFRYAFRIIGNTTGRRRCVDAALALAGYAACHPNAKVERESYLSAFQFGTDFRTYLVETGSTKGFDGPCWAPAVWWDIDNEDDPQTALDGTRQLTAAILDRYRILDDEDLLRFFSGSKGFHVGLPLCWNAPRSLDFNRVSRRFAEGFAQLAGVKIDTSIYDKVRAFRAPNSRHPKTGLHKRRLTHEELMGLSLDGIRRLAESPEPFALPAPSAMCEQAAADWSDAAARAREEAEGKAQRRAAVANGTPTLNRQTLDFIRDGTEQGDRHRLLFSAAANLAEFNCPPALAHALLTDAALDSGLSPSDVRRQIECGLAHVKGSTHG
jgi:hypothetical protein